MRSHEEVSRKKAGAALRAKAQRAADPPHELLDLQQRSGNAAVARLVVQRDRAASTDAPGRSRSKKKPPPPKKAAADIHARVIKADVDADAALITIGAGTDQGVKVGMTGSLVTEKGREIADFTIERANGRVSYAHVHVILDQVRANPDVIVKASQFADESMEGKEF